MNFVSAFYLLDTILAQCHIC